MRQPKRKLALRPKAGTTGVGKRLPVIVEKGSDGYYVVECPLFEGCYTQGKTIDEALRNIREVIDLILEDAAARQLLRTYRPEEISLHTISL